MPESVHYREDRNLIQVDSVGVTTIEDWKGSLETIMRLSEKHGTHKVLVDTREQVGTPATIEIFDFGRKIPQSLRVAIITSDPTTDAQSFLETVGSNRGLVIGTFSTEDEALRWLDVGAAKE